VCCTEGVPIPAVYETPGAALLIVSQPKR
jgi:hypothetical protein